MLILPWLVVLILWTWLRFIDIVRCNSSNEYYSSYKRRYDLVCRLCLGNREGKTITMKYWAHKRKIQAWDNKTWKWIKQQKSSIICKWQHREKSPKTITKNKESKTKQHKKLSLFCFVVLFFERCLFVLQKKATCLFPLKIHVEKCFFAI